MPALEVHDLRQKAVLWPRLGGDGQGDPTVSGPVEIACRFNAKQREALDPHGNTIALDGIIVTATDVPDGSIVWEGGLDDLPLSQVPTSGLMQVKLFNSSPDIKNRQRRRDAGLMRFRDRLPWADPLLTGLAAFWRNDGRDWSGNSASLTSHGSPGKAVGAEGKSASAALLSTGNWFDAVRPFAAAPFSFSALFRLDGSGAIAANQSIVGGENAGGALVNDWLAFHGNSTLVSDVWAAPVSAAAAYTAGQFNAYGLSYDGATVRLYWNGLLVASLATTVNLATFPNIGIGNGGASMRVQNVGAWTKALAAADFRRLWNKGSGFDPTTLRN